MTLRLAVVASLALSLGSGCHLYFGGDDDPPPCDFATGDIAVEGQINPETGQCEFFGGPWCNDECGPCPAADQAFPSWAFCNSECTGLAEDSCQETSGCRAIYGDNRQLSYEGCWGTDQTGPVQGGDCTTFDAFECSRHDDCFAIHQAPCAIDAAGAEAPSCEVGAFVSCGNEPGNTGGPGDCYGEVACDEEPPACPADTMPGIRDGCWSGFCIPIEDCEGAPACGDIGVEATCIARGDCNPRYRGVDCTCDATSCTCADWLFEECAE